jgi:hypothetical protein
LRPIKLRHLQIARRPGIDASRLAFLLLKPHPEHAGFIPCFDLPELETMRVDGVPGWQ